MVLGNWKSRSQNNSQNRDSLFFSIMVYNLQCGFRVISPLCLKAHTHTLIQYSWYKWQTMTWTSQQGGGPGPCPKDEMQRRGWCYRGERTHREPRCSCYSWHAEASIPASCLPLMWIIPPSSNGFLPEVLQSLSHSWFSSFLSRCPCIVFFEGFSPPLCKPSSPQSLSPGLTLSLSASILPHASATISVLTTHRSLSPALLIQPIL